MLSKKLCTLAAGLVALNSACGAGFQLYNEGSAEAFALASAITARDDLTSLAWYNPAALAGTDKESIMIGASLAQLNSDFDGATNESLKKQWIGIPHAYYVKPINESMTFTFSLNAPYGLTTEWDSDSTLALLSEKAELSSIYATPSIAYKLNDMVSLSVGINAVYADAELAKTVHPAYGGGRRTITADDYGLGGTAALHLHLNDDWAFGARYQSEVSLTLKGDADYSNGSASHSAQAELTLPDTMTLGVTYSGFEKWKLGFDAVWTDWADFDQLVYEFPNGTETAVQEWDKVWGFHLGAEYQLNESWVLRGGYVWDQSPVSDEHLSPMLPGSDRQILTVGVGYILEHWTIDAAYGYIWGRTADQGTEVVSAAGAAGLDVDGEYDTTAHMLSCSVGYNF